MKMMVRWLLGMGNGAPAALISTLRLMYTMVLHEGDLMEKGKVSTSTVWNFSYFIIEFTKNIFFPTIPRDATFPTFAGIPTFSLGFLY